jgi:hypothetical protein
MTVLSQELENSLQQAIDDYLGERLRTIDEQLSRLQGEFEETVARLRESSAPVSITATPLAETIAAHLQTAREQKLSGATGQPSPDPVSDIKLAAAAIDKQQTQSDVLTTLLKAATLFADRIALFVIRDEQAIGWRECEANDASNVESIRSVAFPLSADTIVTRAVHSRSMESAPSESNQSLTDELGGEPRNAVAVPLVVREKVVAVLYADSPSADRLTINADALELLARISAMAVNALAGARQTHPTAARQPETATAAPAPVEPQYPAAPVAPEVHVPPAEPEAVQAAPVPAEPSYTPQVEAHVEVAPAEEIVASPSQSVAPEITEGSEEVAPSATSDLPEPAPAQPTSVPVFTSSFSTPLGGARRYGLTEPELPVEVSEEERRLHNDARRFARLLVSEIKLYNEQKVKDGRSGGDLYDRLREDIDRSRQMYDKRVAPPVAARHDYFHQELVNTLAEGDPNKLGANYPGNAVVG